MAGRSFEDEELVRFSRAFVPVLVDADTHPEAKKKYGVSRLPAVRFTKNDGTQLTGVEGNHVALVVIEMGEAALKKNGSVELEKEYLPLAELSQRLELMAREKKPAETLAAARAIVAFEREGSDRKRALWWIARLEKQALAEFDALRENEKEETDPRAGYRKLIERFPDTPAAEKAAKRVAALKRPL